MLDSMVHGSYLKGPFDHILESSSSEQLQSLENYSVSVIKLVISLYS